MTFGQRVILNVLGWRSISESYPPHGVDFFAAYFREHDVGGIEAVPQQALLQLSRLAFARAADKCGSPRPRWKGYILQMEGIAAMLVEALRGNGVADVRVRGILMFYHVGEIKK
jgi:hypothetical protein